MKTLAKILPLVVLLASCGSDDDAIKKKIILKKQQIAQMEQQIVELEKQLSDTTKTNNLIPVSVKEMKEEPFNHFFIVYGDVEADKYGNLSPEMNGRVESILVSEGQSVTKGQLLLTLNTEALKSQLEGLKVNLDFATSNFEKQKTLWDQKIGSEMQYLQAKSAKEGLEAQVEATDAQIKMSQLRAPFDGVVNRIYPKKGEMAGPGFPAIEFVNLSQMTIRAQVSEKYIDVVDQGQKVEVSFSSIPGLLLEPKITRVSNVINPKSRTFEIELKLENPKERIKPNMISTIRINDYTSERAFLVPSLVVKKDFGANYVYVAAVTDNGFVIEKRKVTLGHSYEDVTEVLEGLKTGDKVIVKGYNLVSTGIPVKIM